MEQKKVIILGATGFIGSYVAEAIQGKEPYKLLCLVRKSSDTNFLESIGATCKVIDFENIIALQEEFLKADFIINCLAMTNGDQNLRKTTELNLLKTIEKALSNNNAAFIHLGSIISYGYKLPSTPIDENYIAQKTDFEDKISILKDDFIINSKTIRNYLIIQPVSTLGARDNHSFSYNLKLQHKQGKFPLVSGGKSKISIIDTRDIGRAFLFVIENWENIKQGKYLISGYDTSWNKIKSMFDEKSGKGQKAIHIPSVLIKVFGFISDAFRLSDEITRKAASFLSKNKLYNAGKMTEYGFKPVYNLEDNVGSLFEHNESNK